jgi:hypothetical protein
MRSLRKLFRRVLALCAQKLTAPFERWQRGRRQLREFAAQRELIEIHRGLTLTQQEREQAMSGDQVRSWLQRPPKQRY